MVIVFFNRGYQEVVYTCFYNADYNISYFYNKACHYAESVLESHPEATYFEIFDYKKYNLIFN